MAYYRFEVPGGEFVLQGDLYWQVMFNGIQIGGLYRHPQDALHAIGRRREALLAGPDLTGIADPPRDLQAWETAICYAAAAA